MRDLINRPSLAPDDVPSRENGIDDVEVLLIEMNPTEQVRVVCKVCA
jgi:hypothetical protein